MGEIIKSDEDPKDVVVYEEVNSKSTLEEDIDTARSNIHNTIDISSKAIGEMSDIAYQSQHPAAYDVLNNMIKVQATLNKNLIELQEKKKNLNNGVKEEAPTKNVTNYNSFHGSTAELADLIKQNKENES